MTNELTYSLALFLSCSRQRRGGPNNFVNIRMVARVFAVVSPLHTAVDIHYKRAGEHLHIPRRLALAMPPRYRPHARLRQTGREELTERGLLKAILPIHFGVMIHKTGHAGGATATMQLGMFWFTQTNHHDL